MKSSLLLEPQFHAADVTPRHTILIVDDNKLLADALSHQLQQQGFATLTAGSGGEARSVARSAHPDVVVLNLRLPDTDGLGVCRQLVDARETCGVPVIMVAERARPNIVRRCRAAGCQYFLRKPYDPSVLLILIHEALRQSAGNWCDLPQ